MSTQELQTEAPLKLYAGNPMHDIFPLLKDLIPTRVMQASNKRGEFSLGQQISLPDHYDYQSERCSTSQFLRDTDTSALLVLKQGQIAYEQYYLTGGPDVHWISFSMSKSIISALIGIAIEQGDIASVHDSISDYVPTLKKSGYDGVSILNVLQMSSGARWSEDYSDPNAEVHRFEAVMSGQDSLENFIASIQRQDPPGTICRYNSADTMALGLMLAKAVGRPIAGYMQEKICEPLGMESPGYWLIDREGMEMAAGGVLMTARDFAKIGELFRLKGKWNGLQIVPQSWVEASTAINAPHLEAGQVILNDHDFPLGYGYQWWIPDGDCGEFSAIGVYNQFIYVDPSRGVVIVKLSANRRYGTSPSESTNREIETLALLRSIARSTDL